MRLRGEQDKTLRVEQAVTRGAEQDVIVSVGRT
jgi:hypothetical protein